MWSRDGLLLAFTSNARNGKDRDLYVISPPDTATGRKLKEADGYCIAHDWSPDGSRIVATESRFHRREQVVVLIDVLNGRDRIATVAFRDTTLSAITFDGRAMGGRCTG